VDKLKATESVAAVALQIYADELAEKTKAKEDIAKQLFRAKDAKEALDQQGSNPSTATRLEKKIRALEKTQQQRDDDFEDVVRKGQAQHMKTSEELSHKIIQVWHEAKKNVVGKLHHEVQLLEEAEITATAVKDQFDAMAQLVVETDQGDNKKWSSALADLVERLEKANKRKCSIGTRIEELEKEKLLLQDAENKALQDLANILHDERTVTAKIERGVVTGEGPRGEALSIDLQYKRVLIDILRAKGYSNERASVALVDAGWDLEKAWARLRSEPEILFH